MQLIKLWAAVPGAGAWKGSVAPGHQGVLPVPERACRDSRSAPRQGAEPKARGPPTELAFPQNDHYDSNVVHFLPRSTP